MKKRIDPALVIIPLAALLLTLYLVYFVIKQTREPRLPEPEYAGRNTCFECHEDEQRAFYNSHHDLAMDEANENTVLADFNDTFFVYFGDTTWFYKRKNEYLMKTIGRDGNYQEFKIKYVFGYTPLQQYLVEFPGGRYQMSPFCWDTNTKEKGGQRWFHIYPNEKILPGDELHWTGLNQNWNYMCAECHSTDLKKNYDLASNTYHTTWNEIDVSCEACHGPGSAHNEWARLDKNGRAPSDPNMGLVLLSKEEEVSWIFDTITGIATRSKPRTDHTQIELCGRCHSRRFVVWDDYVHGKPLLQTHRPDILFDHLYHYDGQIKEEDYVYGSFLQSKMYQAGVTCTDCHDAHSYQPIAEGNMVCAKCHLTTKYDSPDHHFHKMDSTGASCLDCHMPTTTYMVNDPRRDHSMRIPRPDLSLITGSPNACNQCHSDKSIRWADKEFRKWYGNKYDTIPHFGETFHAAANNQSAAAQELINIMHDTTQTAIVRSSAIYYLNNYLNSEKARQETVNMLDEKAALIKVTALQSLNNYPLQPHLSSIIPLLKDSIRGVRMEVMRLLATLPPEYYPEKHKELIEGSLDEYKASVLANADQPGANINLGVMYASLQKLEEAEKHYRYAIRNDSTSIAAYVNLADLYRMQNDDINGENVLLRALQIDPEVAEVHYSLGLLYARKQQIDKAINHLQEAVEINPANSRFRYIYGIALNSVNNTPEAIKELKKALSLSPSDQEILFALATIYRDKNNLEEAKRYAQKILDLYPDNQQARMLLESVSN